MGISLFYTDPLSLLGAAMRRIFVILIILLVATTGFSLLHAQTTPTPTPNPSIVSDLFNRINQLRASLSLPAYTLSASLSAAAQDQAIWMATTGNVTHTRPDGSVPATRAALAGYQSLWCC